MSSLQELNFNYELFLDKSTLIFGETGTGKSFIMCDILYHLKPHVDQIIVISPMDRQNHTYDSGIVPTPCIHYTISPKLLDDIWERQSALVSVYTRANRPDILRLLYNRVSDSVTMDAIDSINNKLCDYKNEIASGGYDEASAKAKMTEMEDKCKKLIILIFKQVINDNRSKLSKMNLSKEEQYSLKFLNINPRLVLVFDDCTDLLKKIKTHPVIQKLFYQGRWADITVLIACHTDKALDPELKKNAHISIFTEDSCAHAYFSRPSNDLDKDAKKRAVLACKSVFSPLAKHRKLYWVRNEKKFYHYTAVKHPNLEFGSPYFRDYCNKIKADASTISSDNKFIGEFI